MTRLLVVLLALSVAPARAQVPDTSDEPRITAAVLTLAKRGRSTRLLVQRSEVTHTRGDKACVVHVKLSTPHPQFRTIELDLAYPPATTAAKTVPLQVVARTPRQGDAPGRGSARLAFKNQSGGTTRIVAKLDARIMHMRATWQLRGTVEVANTACGK